MAKKKKPEPEDNEPPPWMQDGRRFVASLQKPNDPQCYNDFFDSDTLNEAQSMADNAAKREGRKAIVFDRKNQEFAFRCDYTIPKEPPPEEPKKGRGRGKPGIRIKNERREN